MIRTGGWERHSVWEHSRALRELYARRARGVEPEMTCAAQAAELLEPMVTPGDSLLDVGCGAGHFVHSLQSRGIDVQYFGIDASRTFVDIGREALAPFGVEPRQLEVMRIEDLDATVDHIVCLNVLTNMDNVHRPLERLLQCARKSVILRESIADEASTQYVVDRFLDDDACVKVHVNTYARSEIMALIAEHGFVASEYVDRRSDGKVEMVIGYPHHWTFIVAAQQTK